MEAVVLEKAPRGGGLRAAQRAAVGRRRDAWRSSTPRSPTRRLWDDEVLRGDLPKYDWLHLHHEDFTGQHGKFYAAYARLRLVPRARRRCRRRWRARLGFAKVSRAQERGGADDQGLRGRGGFLFAMCSATDTYDIALAAQGVGHRRRALRRRPARPGARSRKLDFARTLAFQDFTLDHRPARLRVLRHRHAPTRPRCAGRARFFTLFDFSAKNDPVPTMLTQDHAQRGAGVPGPDDRRSRRRCSSPAWSSSAETEGTDEVKYLHGNFGKGTFTFLGGHDPEDYQHAGRRPADRPVPAQELARATG